jgi:hypothetical protein
MGKIENMAHSSADADPAESLQQLVNRRAYRLAQGQYQWYRRMISADLAAGRITVAGIETWKPAAAPSSVEPDPMGDLPL